MARSEAVAWRRLLEQAVLRRQRDVLEALHAMEHTLAGVGPHVRHVAMTFSRSVTP